MNSTKRKLNEKLHKLGSSFDDNNDSLPDLIMDEEIKQWLDEQDDYEFKRSWMDADDNSYSYLSSLIEEKTDKHHASKSKMMRIGADNKTEKDFSVNKKPSWMPNRRSDESTYDEKQMKKEKPNIEETVYKSTKNDKSDSRQSESVGLVLVNCQPKTSLISNNTGDHFCQNKRKTFDDGPEPQAAVHINSRQGNSSPWKTHYSIDEDEFKLDETVNFWAYTSQNIPDTKYTDPMNSEQKIERAEGTILKRRERSSRLEKFKRFFYLNIRSVWNICFGEYSATDTERCYFFLETEAQNSLLRGNIGLSKNKKELALRMINSLQEAAWFYKGTVANNKGKVNTTNKYLDLSSTMRTRKTKLGVNYEQLRAVASECMEYYERCFKKLPTCEDEEKYTASSFLKIFNRAVTENLRSEIKIYADLRKVFERDLASFCEILSIPSKEFFPEFGFNLRGAVFCQLKVFFNSNLAVKALFMPEILSLRSRCRAFSYDWSKTGIYKIYICYYIMCKLESYIDFVKSLMDRKSFTSENLMKADINFYRLYIRDFYLSYLLHNLFQFNYQALFTYTVYYRLQFLFFFKFENEMSVDESFGHFLEFMFFNLVDSISFFEIDCFIECFFSFVDPKPVEQNLWQLESLTVFFSGSQEKYEALVHEFLYNFTGGALFDEIEYSGFSAEVLKDLSDDDFEQKRAHFFLKWTKKAQEIILKFMKADS